MKVITEIIAEYRDIWIQCPKCGSVNYGGKYPPNNIPQNGENSCMSCSTKYRWQEIEDE